jgi:hypothetical protein
MAHRALTRGLSASLSGWLGVGTQRFSSGLSFQKMFILCSFL